MNTRLKKDTKESRFEKPSLAVDKIADADTVIGDPITTVSGTQVIPLSSVTIVNMGGGGEYGDVKTFREADGFKLAGGNSTVITVKPRGFLVDDGKECKLLRVDDGPIETLIEKTGELFQKLKDNV